MNTLPDTEGARAFAVSEVARYTSRHVAQSPEEVFLWWSLGLGYNDFGRISVPPGAAEVICAHALVNEGARDLARFLCYHFITSSGHLPKGFTEFAAFAVMDRLPKLKKPGKKRKLGDRDLFIVMMLHDMQLEYHVKPRRNAQRTPGSAEPPSGCDILSEAFRAVSGWAEVTYDTCAKAWQNRKWALAVMREMEKPPRPLNALAYL